MTRCGCAELLSGSSALAAASGCAHFPALPGGAGAIEDDPLFREAMASAPVLPGNEVTPIHGDRRTFRAQFREVEAARDHVNLEFFILQDVRLPGYTGPLLLDLLRRKLGQGVAVTIIHDSIGSAGTPDAALASLREAGANLLSLNPANPFEARGAWRPNARDHRKIAVADGRAAGMGGVHFDPVYENSCGDLPPDEPVESTDDACWADVATRVEGPAGGAATAPPRHLGEAGRRPAAGPGLVPAARATGRHRHARVRQRARRGQAALPRRAPGRDHGRAPHHPALHRLLRADAAGGRRTGSGRAARRGRAPAAAGRDRHAPGHARAARVPRAAVGGRGRISEFTDSVLHAKIAVVDGAWSAVGSSNLDRRSVAWNNEVGAVLLGPELGAALEAAMGGVAARAAPATLEGRVAPARRGPAASRSCWPSP